LTPSLLEGRRHGGDRIGLDQPKPSQLDDMFGVEGVAALAAPTRLDSGFARRSFAILYISVFTRNLGVLLPLFFLLTFSVFAFSCVRLPAGWSS
jgi:hypothetical protein